MSNNSAVISPILTKLEGKREEGEMHHGYRLVFHISKDTMVSHFFFRLTVKGMQYKEYKLLHLKDFFKD